MIDIKEVSSFIERVESITNKSKSLIIRHSSGYCLEEFNIEDTKYKLLAVFCCGNKFGQHLKEVHYFYLTNTGSICIEHPSENGNPDNIFVKIASLKDGVDECIRVIINQLKVWYPEVNKNAG